MTNFKVSAAGTWVPCPSSVLLPSFSSERTDAMLEGEAAHYVAEQALRNRSGFDLATLTDTRAPNGYVIDGDMVEFAKEYATAVDPAAEVEVALSQQNGSASEIRGRADALLVTDDLISVWDYKYGHRYVDVEDNWQLIVTAFMAHLQGCQTRNNPDWKPAHVTMTLFQPRCYTAATCRTVTMPWDEFADKYHVRVVAAVAAATSGKLDALQTGEHCMGCSSRHACPLLQRKAFEIVDLVDGGLPDLAELDDRVSLGVELAVLESASDRLEARVKALRERATQKIKEGQSVLGYEAQHQSTPLKWTVDKATVLAMGTLAGVDVSKPADVVTPTQAIKAGMLEAVVSRISQRGSTELKLKRVNVNKIRKVFK